MQPNKQLLLSANNVQNTKEDTGTGAKGTLQTEPMFNSDLHTVVSQTIVNCKEETLQHSQWVLIKIQYGTD